MLSSDIKLPDSPKQLTRELINELIKRRKQQWDWANDNIENQALTMELCKRDMIFWANNWVWVYDPRNLPEKPATVPLILFSKQEEFLLWLGERRDRKENGLVEKCRDSGATFLSIIYSTHGWLFEEGFKATFGSRKEDLVDNSDDPDSIFEKIRSLLSYLPHWMLPVGYNENRHSKYMRIKNPANGSTMTGEAGENMGRGGRATIYFKDEAAHLAHAEQVEAAVSHTSDVVIDISTPRGLGNPFARKRHSGTIPVFIFRWTDDPRKSKVWFNKKKRSSDKRVFAQEVEIDYGASMDEVLIPSEYVRAACNLKLPPEYLEYNKSFPKIAGLDISDSGDNKTVFITRRGIVVLSVLSWQKTNTTQTAYRAIRIGNRQNISKLYYDRMGVGAGVAGTLESSEYDEYSLSNSENIDNLAQFEFEGFIAGGKCSDETWEAFGDRKSNQIFSNLKAEAAWLLRTRFERTYEYVEEGIQHDLDTLIYLPVDSLRATNNLQMQLFQSTDNIDLETDTGSLDDYSNDIDALLAQISIPRFFDGDSGGLIRIEKKKEMKTRGVKSPDFFDALVLAFCGENEFDAIEAMNRAD